MVLYYQRLSISLGKFVNWFRYVREELSNQKLGREQVGTDRDGNKYYQYYSYYGLPTRREVRFADPLVITLNDLVYYRWLYKFQFDPPSEREKQEFYLEEKLRKKRALEWDLKDQKLVEDYRKQRELLLIRNQALRELQEESRKQTPLDIKTKRQS